ncbi:MAG: hypothetical protein R3321_10670 [Nitrososphaeraceae archaeon]|nr:hypothetical protein [Nitrososphaeraceae archaeon]
MIKIKVKTLFVISFLLMILLPQNLDAEFYVIKDYPQKIDKIIAMQDKPSPKQQQSDGIFAADVVCSNDFVLVLKLSAREKVVCVSSQTAEKLAERKWGVMRADKTVLGGTSVECRNYFEISYDTIDNFRESEVIKQIRMTLLEFYEEERDRATLIGKLWLSEPYEKTLWGTIAVTSQTSENVTGFIDNSCYTDVNRIIIDLKELEHVKNVKASLQENL